MFIRLGALTHRGQYLIHDLFRIAEEHQRVSMQKPARKRGRTSDSIHLKRYVSLTV